MRAHKLWVCLWGTLLLVSTTLSSDAGMVRRDQSPATLSQQIVDNSTYINANKILMFVNNTGDFARDLGHVFGYDYGTFFPYVSTGYVQGGILTQSPLYAGGLWVGGKVNEETRVVLAEYSTEYVPGPMSEGSFLPDDPSFKVYKLYRDSLEDNPNWAYLNWPAEHGAPVDNQSRPMMLGDQMTWSVFNDADPAAHTNDAGQTEPLGIEVQQTVWATDQDGTDTLSGPTAVPVVHLGATNLGVYVHILDELLMTGHEYRVVVDTSGGLTWSVEDVTAGTTVVPSRALDSPDASAIVDGLLIYIYYPTGLGDWQWTGSARPLTGVNWGGSGFFGGIGVGYEFFVSDLLYDDLRWVEIRWTYPGAGQNAYRYDRSGNPRFAYGGFWPQDFTVWDVTPGLPERQINFSFVEDRDYEFPNHTPMDSLWNPGVQLTDTLVDTSWDPYAGREYFQIMTSDYSGTALSKYMVDGWFNGSGGTSWDVLYGGWLKRREETDGRPDPGDVFLLVPTTRPSSPDTFVFVADPPPVITSGPEGVSIYISYKLYNKGGNVINDCYISMWLDPDLGWAADDLVGCDSLTSSFFCYNSSDSDAIYNAPPPAIGFKVVYGPLAPSTGDTAIFDGKLLPDFKNLPLGSFVRFVNGTDPDNYTQTYWNMQGLDKSGNSHVYDGRVTKFWLSGDPVSGTGDLDFAPTNKRMMASCGPFMFNPGDSQYVLIKMAVGQGADRLSSITRLREILNLPPPFGPPVGCCGRYTGGFTGNTDCDPSGSMTLNDIMRLIDYVYVTHEPLCCHDNGNVDGSTNGSINLADITWLIDNVFITHRVTSACR